MGQMDELLSGLTEELESRQMQKNGIAANVPNVPLMILYMGSQASRARKDITDTLRQVWRRRADSVAQLMVEDGIFYSFSEESPKEISVEEFQEAADKLYAQEDSFHNMNDFLLVMVFDTTDYEKLEKMDAVLDKIRRRYGIDSVMRAAFLGTPIDHRSGGISREKRTVDYRKIRIE